MTTSRSRWEACIRATDEPVSPPYYVAAPAIKVARRVAVERRTVVVVKRNGNVYATYGPEAS